MVNSIYGWSLTVVLFFNDCSLTVVDFIDGWSLTVVDFLMVVEFISAVEH